jgi:hypothetical protein
MAVTEFDSTAEVRAHRRSFIGFERLVLFAVMHIALVLGCLALAFPGDAPTIALLIGIGGTLALIAGFVVTSANER